jgi:predicted helicase
LSIYKLLDEIRDVASNSKIKGDLFEQLMLNFFKTEPTYVSQFSNVWLWKDWPDNGGRPDTGIDLVAENSDGDGFTAIQCKNFSPHVTLNKEDIDSFFNESGKKPFTHRIVVSTTNNWSIHAENSLKGQDKPVRRIGVEALANSEIDWESISINNLKNLKLVEGKKLRAHQSEAINAVIEGFKTNDRGKLIMACGTGKTFTAQCLTEKIVGVGKNVLVLVPSISLLSQSVKEWTANSNLPLNVYAVCSDPKAGRRKDSEDMSAYDLAIPATTNTDALVAHFKNSQSKDRINLFLSTYQSIEIVAEAQRQGLGNFDLIIADEAHRTTGITLAGDDDSYFTRVHDNEFISGTKRLYMTATPRMYGEAAKAKAASAEATLSSMDDVDTFGPEFFRLDFYEAVQRDLLTDYKVIVLAVNEDAVAEAFQRQLSDKNHELKLDEATKIIGCLNAFSKVDPSGRYFANDSIPMKRIVAFSNTIASSKKFRDLFNEVTSRFSVYTDEKTNLKVEIDHVDGSYNSLKREELLGWLKAEPADSYCHVLSNAKCLTEGVDVPSLDGIVFLEPRNSIVDVVQAVGRVMRKSPDKKYGYIILPIGIPSGISPEDALSDNKRFAAVWQVLNALRSHDKRISATINKLDLNNQTPEMIEVIPVGFDDSESTSTNEQETEDKPRALQLEFPLEEIRSAIYAKMIEKVGTRQYWETWANDIAKIAERHISQIEELLEKPNSKASQEFKNFLQGLKDNLNESITREDAIEMLAQHLITKPIFDSIFGNSTFTEKNPVSQVMQTMIAILSDRIIDQDRKMLDGFYADVQIRVEGIDNLEGKQRIITELYEKFFRIAFPRTAARLGIVYTPIEIIDFIINSIEHVLSKDFNTSLSAKNVQILDPFTGTGTFITRLLQSGLIAKEDLEYKYRNELHANELILLAYYIAAINIETVFHELSGSVYQEFEGIVLTDTFQMFEDDDKMDEFVFQKNNSRVLKQKTSPIRVIIGNPPYSVGQEEMNDNNANLTYPTLDSRLKSTYSDNSSTRSTRSVYDSYIRAFRWASDRVGESGVIGFVTNGSFIDARAMDGFRKALTEEFSQIYVLNLRGNQRTQGEVSKKEGGKIFGSGSRAPIAITILVKDGDTQGNGLINYFDIGDFLSREEKLSKVTHLNSIENVSWVKTRIDSHGDWVNQRDEKYLEFDVLADRQSSTKNALLNTYSLGMKTSRDSWACNFSRSELEKNIQVIVKNYTQLLKVFTQENTGKKITQESVNTFVAINSDSTKISWDASLIQKFGKLESIDFDSTHIRKVLYRPFAKKYVYFDKSLNERHYQIPKLFPSSDSENLVMSINQNPLKQFGLIMTDLVPDIQLTGNGQCFPLYTYPNASNQKIAETLFHDEHETGRISSINSSTLDRYRKRFGKDVNEADIFFYVYGLLHSEEFRLRFQNELGKMIPRIPMVGAFREISNIGQMLSKSHVNYEDANIFELTGYKKNLVPEVQKIRFDKKSGKIDKSRLIINDSLVLSDVPEEAHRYEISGRTALEWVVDRYEITQDSNTRIIQNPNLWSADSSYVLDLIGKVISVSLETVDLVEQLPTLGDF